MPSSTSGQNTSWSYAPALPPNLPLPHIQYPSYTNPSSPNTGCFQAPQHLHIEYFSAWNTLLQLKSSYLSFKTLEKHFHTSKAFYALPPRSLIPVFYASKAHCLLFHHEHAYFTLGWTIKSVITLNGTFPLDINNIIPPHINQREHSLNCNYSLTCFANGLSVP